MKEMILKLRMSQRENMANLSGLCISKHNLFCLVHDNVRFFKYDFVINLQTHAYYSLSYIIISTSVTLLFSISYVCLKNKYLAALCVSIWVIKISTNKQCYVGSSTHFVKQPKEWILDPLSHLFIPESATVFLSVSKVLYNRWTDMVLLYGVASHGSWENL